MASSEKGLDYDSMTVVQIKDELVKKGLPTTGKKADLIERLRTLSGHEEPEQTKEGEDMETTDENNQENPDEIMLREDNGEGEQVDEATEEDLLKEDLTDEQPTEQLDQEYAEEVDNPEEQQAGDENDASMNEGETGSLDVDLDPSDIAPVDDLDENKEKEVVTVDTVGDIDDAEFEQGMNVSETEQSMQAKEVEEKKEKILEPAPPGSLMNWYLGRFSSCKRFCSVYFSVRQPTDMLRPEVQEWAKKAARFIINQNYEGQGSAVFDFRTEQEGIDCKDAILALLGSEITIIHPSRSTEKQVLEGTTYRPLDYSSYNRRTCIVEGFPEATKPEDLRTLFSEAVMVARPLIPSKVYRWRNQDYNLPEGTEQQFLVEFLTSKAAERAVEEHKDFLVDGNQIKVQLVDGFINSYRTVWSKKQDEIKEQRRKEEEALREKRAKETLPDKERLDLCRQLSNTMKERQRINRQGNMPWAAKLSITDKLSKKVLDIVRTLDADTDKRKQQGKSIPEPSHLMTKHTRHVAGEGKEPRESESQPKEDGAGALDDKERLRTVRQLKLTRDQKTALQDDNSLPWNQKMMTMDKLENKIKTFIMKLDADTKLRLDTGSGVPETTAQMTKYTRQMLPRLKRNRKDSSTSGTNQAQAQESTKVDDKDKPSKEDNGAKAEEKEKPDNEISSSTEKGSSSSEGKKESPKSTTATKDDKPKKDTKEDKPKDREKRRSRSRSPVPPTDRATQRMMDQEIRRLEPDNRGWWSVSATMHKDLAKRETARSIFSKFGTIMEIHYTKSKLFLRFDSRSGAIKAIRHFYTKYGVRVPEVNPQYKQQGGRGGPAARDSSPVRGRARGRPARRSAEPPMRDMPFVNQPQPQMLALQQQQQQQQMMYQQQLLQQQQLAAQEQAMRQPMGSLLGDPHVAAIPAAYDADMQNRGVKRFPTNNDYPQTSKRRRSVSPPIRSASQSYYGSGDMRSRDYYGDQRASRVDNVPMGGRAEEKTSDPSAIANVLKGLTQVISSKMEMLSRSGSGQQAGKQAMKEVMDTLGHATHSLGQPGSRGMKEPINRSGAGLLPAPSSAESRGYSLMGSPEKAYPKPVPPVQYPDPYAYDDGSRRGYGAREGQMGYGMDYSNNSQSFDRRY